MCYVPLCDSSFFLSKILNFKLTISLLTVTFVTIQTDSSILTLIASIPQITCFNKSYTITDTHIYINHTYMYAHTHIYPIYTHTYIYWNKVVWMLFLFTNSTVVQTELANTQENLSNKMKF